MKAIEQGAILFFLEGTTATEFRNFEHLKREGEKKKKFLLQKENSNTCHVQVELFYFPKMIKEKVVVRLVNEEQGSLSITTRITRL